MPWDTRNTHDPSDTVAALYLHVPFCRQKCAYCDFHSRATPHGDPCLAAYADELASQVARLAQTGLLAACRTAYLGGGTPTLLGDALPGLVRAVRAACPALTELTCEANPESAHPELLGCLAEAGVTRLSVGIQSTDDAELRELGRIHTAGQATAALRAAVAAGLDVSADLMCAIPHQTEASWTRSLHDVLTCGVSHVSVYPLQIEEDTPLAARVGEDEPAWNATDVQAARMEQAERILTEAGLTRYEVASYAKGSHACAHNLAYWTGKSYLGLGPSAASMLARPVYQRLCECVPRLPEPPADADRIRLRIDPPAQPQLNRQVAHAHPQPDLKLELELLTRPQALAEDLMLAMRTSDGIGPELLESAQHVLGEGKVAAALGRLAARGLAEPAWGGRWVPTHQGWLLGNELFAELWDLAPSTRTTTQELTL